MCVYLECIFGLLLFYGCIEVRGQVENRAALNHCLAPRHYSTSTAKLNGISSLKDLSAVCCFDQPFSLLAILYINKHPHTHIPVVAIKHSL